jgi:tetratricopeptide (TPR) repeat protein
MLDDKQKKRVAQSDENKSVETFTRRGALKRIAHNTGGIALIAAFPSLAFAKQSLYKLYKIDANKNRQDLDLFSYFSTYSSTATYFAYGSYSSHYSSYSSYGYSSYGGSSGYSSYGGSSDARFSTCFGPLLDPILFPRKLSIYETEEKGDQYYQDGNYKKAIKYYNKVLRRDPEYPVYLRRGESYVKLGNYQQAKKDFDQALKLDPNIKEVYYYDLACLYSLKNDKSKALKHLELALRNGYTRFDHIAKDSDLDNIRYTKQFDWLIRKYKK